MSHIYKDRLLQLFAEEEGERKELSLRERAKRDINKARITWKVATAMGATSSVAPFWVPVLTVPSEFVGDLQNRFTEAAGVEGPVLTEDLYQDFINEVEQEGLEIKLARTEVSSSQRFYQLVVKIPRSK